MYSFYPIIFSNASNNRSHKRNRWRKLLTGAVAELRNAKDSSLAKVSVADVNGVYHLENPKARQLLY
ncbi:MAG: hypothetical protein IPG39_19155 [Bacteroidetes bacterium]|nr:hypothetical protein [Bacteroidota bacterium]